MRKCPLRDFFQFEDKSNSQSLYSRCQTHESIMSTRQEEANITYQVTHTGVTHSQVTHNQVTQDSNPPTHQQIWSQKDNQSHQVQE